MNATAPSFLSGLQDPRVFDHPVGSFEIVETHISWVLLTGPFAYKIKKPVNLGFLDFSSLEKRKFYCEEEVRLNRRLCPDLYVGVVSLTGDPRRPVLGGPGEPFEFMVKMKQFDEDLLWDRLSERGELRAEWLDDLALRTAEFHARAPRAALESPYGRPETFWVSVQATLEHIGHRMRQIEDRKRCQGLARWLEKAYGELAPRMTERREEGRVREVHGDLHLRNIALFSRAQPDPLIFDGIEFNDKLRWIDVINDVAFLFMDLEHRKRSGLAWRFLNVYLERTGDYGGLDLLRFYAANRALVRAKVLAIQEAEEAGGDQSIEGPSESREFLKLAEAYTRAPKPRLYITHGLSGAGKTTETQKLLEKWRVVRIRSDVERKRLFGLAPEDPSSPQQKEAMYGAEGNRRTYSRLKDLARGLLKAGCPVIVDAAFLRRQPREEFRKLASELQAEFGILDFRLEEDLLRRRIQRRLDENTDASEADLNVLSDQIRSRENLAPEEESCVVPL